VSRGLKLALGAAVAVKAAVVVTILVGHFTVPFSEPGYWSNFAYPIEEEPSLRSAFKTWDGNHYLYLADRWYGPKHISNAFYPLLPALMRAAAPLAGGDALLAGLAVSLVSAVAAVGYLFALTRAWRDEATALRACLLALAFPTAFYFGLLYSEAPFLLLALALFFHLRRGDLVPSLVCAAALPLTRPTGLLVAVPALVAVFTAEPGLRPTARKLLVPLAFAAGFAAYLGVLYAATGDALAGFEARLVLRELPLGGVDAQRLHHQRAQPARLRALRRRARGLLALPAARPPRVRGRAGARPGDVGPHDLLHPVRRRGLPALHVRRGAAAGLAARGGARAGLRPPGGRAAGARLEPLGRLTTRGPARV
jgi:hypothetical protein